MTMFQQRQPFPDAVAERVIQLLRAGTAPWQQRHGPGEGPELPMNPANGNRYKGINAVQLMSQGRDDPRWLTYDQAQELGAQVRKGEQGTRVQFWKLAEERQKTDNGQPALDSHGCWRRSGSAYFRWSRRTFRRCRRTSMAACLRWCRRTLMAVSRTPV